MAQSSLLFNYRDATRLLQHFFIQFSRQKTLHEEVGRETPMSGTLMNLSVTVKLTFKAKSILPS